MKERGLPLSAPMVRATLCEIDPKTQTRRVMKLDDIPQSAQFTGWQDHRGRPAAMFSWTEDKSVSSFGGLCCPYGEPGDRLWVREAWRVSSAHDALPPRDIPQDVSIEYIADGRGYFDGRYRHARFMPRWAARITLEVTGIRVERLQDISDDDAIAEGIERTGRHWKSYGGAGRFYRSPIRSYESLWESINGGGSWAANPLVWVVEFKRVSA